MKKNNKTPKPYRSEYVSIRNQRIYVEFYGNPDGKTLVISHGSLSSINPMAAAGKEHYNIIMFDQCGYGKSRNEGILSTYKDCVKDIKFILDFYGVTKASFFGSSAFSTIALLFAEKYPKMTEEMFLTAPFVGRKEDIDFCFQGSKEILPEYWEKFTENIPENRKENVARYYFEEIQNVSDFQKNQIATKVINYISQLMALNPSSATTYSMVGPENVKDVETFLFQYSNYCHLEKNEILENAHKITCPVHLFSCENDKISQLDSVKLLNGVLPNSTLQIIKEGHHGDEREYLLVNRVMNQK